MKKYLALLLAALLSASLCACEPGSKQESTTVTTATTEWVTTTSEPTTATTTTTVTTTGPLCGGTGELTTTTEPTATTMPRPVTDKPVIYLYPTAPMSVSVKLDFNGTLTCTYPAYRDGWKVIAHPDGTLTDPATGREYYCLYWEGVSDVEYDLSQGFVVPGEDTAAFLEDALAQLGLTEREANEFIIYWLPRMEGNAYNLITFQTDVYTENAKLTVTPTPDSMLRVFMAWKPLDAPIEIEPQELTGFDRHGFTVVEWGGAELK